MNNAKDISITSFVWVKHQPKVVRLEVRINVNGALFLLKSEDLSKDKRKLKFAGSFYGATTSGEIKIDFDNNRLIIIDLRSKTDYAEIDGEFNGQILGTF